MSTTQLICSACAHSNREGARFCEECGASLAATCPSCGAEASSTARFCDTCGTPLGQSASSDGPEPVTAAVRKTVTAVFADLVGSTALQERLDVESVRALMARFYEAMRSVLEGHGGRVEKFIGDAVVAVFGAPVLREDDALRAVRAADAMRTRLGELNDEVGRDWGVHLALRTGVHTGELVTGEGSDGAELMLGDVMNTAARLEQAAGAGEVLISAETRSMVRDMVELELVGTLDLKGKAEPVRAWRLIAIKRASQPREKSLDPPLIGRDGELARVHAVYQDALDARACRLVTVIGSPGVGKTRLAREFARVLGERATVVVGQCERSDEGMTLLPVADVLRALAGIGEADPPEVVRAKLNDLSPDDPDRERITKRTAGVLGVEEPSSVEETFWALRREFELLARRRPMVVVLDDIHWGQPLFLDLIEHLIEWIRDAPVLILALARGELREVRGALASAGRRASDVIELSPLGEDESRALVTELLGGQQLPDALGDRILKRSEGNPLFLGEMMRMLVDEGVLARDGESWVAAGDVDAVEVPLTIQALLAARIERLGAAERLVVERAAVIGKQFYRGAVAQLVTAGVRTEIDGYLEALRRKDMVEPEGTYWIDEPVYRFHHVLIRDAAYRSLLKEARAELHERFADWLQAKAGELVGEHEEVIAFHLEQAHEYRRQLGALDERARALGERAAARLHSAGRRALARADLAAAANLLSRALDREAGEEEEILWDLCETVLSAGDTVKARGLVDRFAAVSARRVRDIARVKVLEGQLANLTGAGDAAARIESVAEAARELGELGDRVGEAKAWHVGAQAHAHLGQIGSTEQLLSRALDVARTTDDSRRVTAVLADAPSPAVWGPTPILQASGRCLDVVRILRLTPGNRHVEAIAMRCQAVLEAMRRRHDAGRGLIAAATANLEELGLSVELHATAIHAGMVELLAGDPVAAEQLLRRALDGFLALGLESSGAQAAALLGRALVNQQRFDEAFAPTSFAAEHGGEDLKTTIVGLGARAEALALKGEVQPALELAQRAFALVSKTDALADRADTSMVLARVLRLADQEAAAREAASAARELYARKQHLVGLDRLTELGYAESATSADTSPLPSGLGSTEGELRAPNQLLVEYKRRFDAHDLKAVIELYTEQWIQIDRRRLGWESTSGRAGVESLWGSMFAFHSDVRIELDETLACDDRVVARRLRFRGTADESLGGGEWEIPMGVVLVSEDGLAVSSDRFEYDDDAAMLAGYAERGGT